VVPASFLADEGTATVGVFAPLEALSNTQTFTITDNVPTATASLFQTRTGKFATISGSFSDSTAEDHHLRINWGDGTIQDEDLGVNAGGSFSAPHIYAGTPRVHVVTVTFVDEDGTASGTLVFVVRPQKAGHKAVRHHVT
jgi:hypothetical protein